MEPAEEPGFARPSRDVLPQFAASVCKNLKDFDGSELEFLNNQYI